MEEYEKRPEFCVCVKTHTKIISFGINEKIVYVSSLAIDNKRDPTTTTTKAAFFTFSFDVQKTDTHTHTHHVHSARLNHFYDLIIRIDIVYTQEMPSAIDAFNLYRFGIFGCLLHHTKSENGRNFIWNGVKEHMT